jgi:hypothetical protein
MDIMTYNKINEVAQNINGGNVFKTYPTYSFNPPVVGQPCALYQDGIIASAQVRPMGRYARLANAISNYATFNSSITPTWHPRMNEYNMDRVSTGKYIHRYFREGTMFCKIVTDNGNSITQGTELNLGLSRNNVLFGDNDYMIYSKLLSSSVYVIFYKGISTQNGTIRALVITISGTTCTLANTYDIVVTQSSASKDTFDIECNADNTKIICVYNKSTAYNTYAIVITVSGSTFSLGTEVLVHTKVTYNDIYPSIIKLNSTLFVIGCQQDNNPRNRYFIPVAINGTSLTLNTAYSISSWIGANKMTYYADGYFLVNGGTTSNTITMLNYNGTSWSTISTKVVSNNTMSSYTNLMLDNDGISTNNVVRITDINKTGISTVKVNADYTLGTVYNTIHGVYSQGSIGIVNTSYGMMLFVNRWNHPTLTGLDYEYYPIDGNSGWSGLSAMQTLGNMSEYPNKGNLSFVVGCSYDSSTDRIMLAIATLTSVYSDDTSYYLMTTHFEVFNQTELTISRVNIKSVAGLYLGNGKVLLKGIGTTSGLIPSLNYYSHPDTGLFNYDSTTTNGSPAIYVGQALSTTELLINEFII